MSLESHSNARFFSMGSKMNCAICYVPWIAFNFFKKTVPRLKNEPLKVLKLIVGRIFWIEISFFNICGHSQPDFGEWVGVAPSMPLKKTYFLQSSMLWQFATLLGPRKWAPPSPPKKIFFLSFPKETWHLVGSVFRGRTQVENWHCAGFPPFFSQHPAAFLGHRWRNSWSCAIYVGIPCLILAKWRKLFWASKGRDALKPNFNKWPEEPFLRSRNDSSGHLWKFGFKASRPVLEKWRKLRHPCPKKDKSDVFPGGFASCPGTTLMSFLVVLPPVLA